MWRWLRRLASTSRVEWNRSLKLKSQYLNVLVVTICLVITPVTVHAEDLLVFMYGSGSVERYIADGKHWGTFISGLLHGWEGNEWIAGELYTIVLIDPVELYTIAV